MDGNISASQIKVIMLHLDHSGLNYFDGWWRLWFIKHFEIMVHVMQILLSLHIRGYHECKDLWTVDHGQSLATKAVTMNLLDKFTIAVLLDVVRHLPKENLGDVQRQSASFSRLMLGISAQWLL